MILMPQIFDVTANENARYKRNELELCFGAIKSRQDKFVKNFTHFINVQNNIS